MTANRAGFVLLGVVAAMVAAGAAAGAPLWTIGKGDELYSEFAIAGKYADYAAAFPNDPVFVIGKSKPEKDWPFIQPGPTDAWAGARKHVFSIQFNLGKTPQDAYRLVVRAADVHSGAAPKLDVNVNDAAQRVLAFQPGKGDASLSDPKAGRQQTQSFLFPASCLHKGRNAIALTVVEGSWLLYDAVFLEKTDVKGVDIAKVEASCTPLFRKAGDEIRQAVRVAVQNDGLEGDATIAIADAPDTEQKVKIEQGANAYTLLVPPFTAVAAQRAVVRVGDKATEAEFEGRPERKWKIYVAPSAHTDIGYTDLQERVFDRHRENTVAMLKACETHPDFKWNMEVFAQVDWFRKQGDAFKTLEQRITEGRVGLTGLYLNMLTGLCTGEEMIKVLAPAQEFARAHNIPVTVATLTDVPTAVGTLPMFLKQAGVKYFVEGINEDRGPVFKHADKRMIQSPFWWEGLDGSRVMAVFTRSYAQAAGIGLRDNAAVVEQRLPGWIKGIAHPDYPCDAIYANGAFGDNESVTPRYIEVANEWNKTWAYPQVIVARADEFFQYVEKNFADALPVFRGDMGSYWEDGAASSALETGQVRVAKARLNAAARWHALAAAQNPKHEFPRADFAKAWEDAIYYDEHTWGAASSISDPKCEQTVKQWDYKADYAHRAAREAAALDASAAHEAFGMIARVAHREKDGAKHVTVPNAYSWPRDVLVCVRDAGQNVCVQETAERRTVPSGGFGGDIVFVAEQVPPLGWRCYALTQGKAAAEVTPLLRQGADPYTWESADFRYRIDSKTGALASIEDLRTHREWVDASSGHGVNQFLYVTGGEGTSLIHPGATPAPPLQPVSHTEASIEAKFSSAELAVLCVKRVGPGVPGVDTAYTFHRDGRVDCVNRVSKEETTKKEAGYFVFPFKLEAPDSVKTFFDLPYGIVEADREQPPGACREWYAANSFAAVTDNRTAAYVATREAPLFTVGQMNRGAWPGKVYNNRGTIFAYVFNNYWHTNYKASQGGGDFSFSIKLTAQPFDPVTGTRFGCETIGSGGVGGFLLCEDAVPGKAARRPADSLIKMADGPVMLSELTQDDQGRLLARLYNPSNEAATTTLEFPKLRVKKAWKTDPFGKQEEPMPVGPGHKVQASVPARGIATLVFETHAK